MRTRMVTRILGAIAGLIPGHNARMLFSFALAEQGSMLDLRAAARLCPSRARRALYLKHALDEERHARMLAQRSAELRRERGQEPLGHPRADIEHLYERLGEIAFVAFVHRGERRGRAQFEVHREAFARRRDDKTRAMFDALVSDERRHEEYTWAVLVEIAGSERRARAALRQAAAWEAWRAWRRAGRAAAQVVYAALMTALYVTLAPLSLLVRAGRTARTRRLSGASVT